MCGILGIWKRDGEAVPARLAADALGCLRHRGPDDEGYALLHGGAVVCRGGPDTPKDVYAADLDYTPERELDLGDRGAPLILAHRRLSILDLSSAGHQPMCTDDQRYWIVHNGEVYNYLELRDELRELSHEFRSDTDTEVILAAYREWGPSCVERFVGMFAFAIHDRQEDTIFLARDPFGIKPLYWTPWERGFAFASEIPALLDLPGVPRRLDLQRAYEFLRYGVSDHGDATFFADVRQVPAGHRAIVNLRTDPGTLRTEPYGSRGSPSQGSTPGKARAVREAFLRNVRLHLRSDVPVGAALSGGIDSSAIVCAMRHVGGDALDLHTLSYIADDAALSEESWVDLVAEAASATTHKVTFDPAELNDDLVALVKLQGEPFGSTSIYAQHRVFRKAREQGITVMLDGQGADELLAGYPSFLGARMSDLLRRGQVMRALRLAHAANKAIGVPWSSIVRSTGAPLLGARLKRWLGTAVPPVSPAPWLDEAWFREHAVKTRPFDNPGTGSQLRQQLACAVGHTMLPMLLRYEDRNAMAASVESRVPFLTPAFADLLAGLPDEELLSDDAVTKKVFREAMRGLVPDAVLDRRDKIGFATPQGGWGATLVPRLRACLAKADDLPAGIDAQAIGEELAAVQGGAAPFAAHHWRLLALLLWAQVFDVSLGPKTSGGVPQ